ncbi:UNVERIFIED_CONTAM: hypothetical protein PYX00_003278 [Menopon gallinae]|uniref:Protein tipE n=1 Tax=Menopon gallinae TaxID=328185 RepID=A0AAW2HZN9_9NEOP
MADETPVVIKQTFLQKLLFYITAFFILLGTISLFAFLFLVPFVIDPAFTTIFMQFQEEPVECVTVSAETYRGASNCTWSSCKEGCTKELYECTQIIVNYRRAENFTVDADARLFPNVKGCGYPPVLNCSIFLKKYREIGANYTCYYSIVEPSLVINEFDINQVYMNLVYAMAIPIPSFIVSVIYLTFAYFVIYAEDNPPRPRPLPPTTTATPVPPPTSGALTPASEVFREDLASFGHDFKVAMADEASRESVATCNDAVPNSNSIPDG